MESSKNYKKIVEVIARQLGKKVETIKPELRMVEDLGADSLDIIEMLMTLEDEYGATIPDDVAMKLKTVADIVSYLDSIDK